MDYRILFAAAFLLFTFEEITAKNYGNCPALYRRYSASHTYCQPKNPTCNILKQGSSDHKNDIIKLHNKFRSIIAQQKEGNRGLPPAADMMLMEWDDELAAVAQKKADDCRYAHDEDDQRRVQEFSVGQNIGKIYDSHVPLKADWERVVSKFYEEIESFNSGLICGGRNINKTGHFTALVWANTYRVGCGYTQFKKDNLYNELYVCNYGPAGNWKEKCVYETGPACSKCPIDTQCVEDLGLCKRINNEVTPHKPDLQKYIFNCDFKNPSPDGDCGVYQEGDGEWRAFKSLEGDYIEVILQPGQNGTIKFAKLIYPPPDSKETAFCIGWTYRRGPNLAKDPNNNVGKVFINPVVPNAVSLPLLTYELKEITKGFYLTGATMPFRFPTQVRISFAVPKGATPQFLNINRVFAYDGRCHI